TRGDRGANGDTTETAATRGREAAARIRGRGAPGGPLRKGARRLRAGEGGSGDRGVVHQFPDHLLVRVPACEEAPEEGARPTAARTSGSAAAPRSEEHTSELQSRENLVCRLL